MTLAALLLIILLLPGFLFSLSFYNSESVQLNNSVTHKTIIGMIYASFVYGITLLIFYFILHEHINFSLLLKLMVKPENEDFRLINQMDLYFFSVYFLCLNFISYYLGRILRSIILSYELDRNEIFRTDNPWIYRFKGYDWAEGDGCPDGIVIGATVEIGNESYLYIGNLVDYHFTKEGELDRIVLDAPSRRLLQNDKGTLPEEKRFYPIDGHLFILKYNEIKNLNIQYFKLIEKNDEDFDVEYADPPKK